MHEQSIRSDLAEDLRQALSGPRASGRSVSDAPLNIDPQDDAASYLSRSSLSQRPHCVPTTPSWPSFHGSSNDEK